MPRISLIQHSCTKDQQDNLNQIIKYIRQAKQEFNTELICLQELHSTQYFCQTQNPEYFNLAEDLDNSQTLQQLQNIAKELNIIIIASIFEHESNLNIYYNTAVVIESDGSIIGKYRKNHIPHDIGFNEKYYFAPGNTPIQPIQTSIGKLGILICWDQWFPEAARAMALEGAEILIYPTAIGWIPDDPDHLRQQYLDKWITIQRSHAIANCLPVVSVNRVGIEQFDNSSIEFWGNSFVCDSEGHIQEQASSTDNNILHCDINFAESIQTRRIWPFLRDRRPAKYSALIQD